jgi:hypothetical protein
MKENADIFKKKSGKVLFHGFVASEADFAEKILEIEQFLNNKVAVEIYKKYQIGIRFQL